MSESPQGADQRPASPHRAQSSRLWRSGRGAQMKLLAALRGEGALVWSGGSIVATYELDVFARGPMKTGSGQMEGDFSALVDSTPSAIDEPCSVPAHLRLDDGREIEIDLVSLEPYSAEFEARGSSAGLLDAAG